MIQAKYCQSGRACINECFDNDGNFRYMLDGKPMQIEVPSDKFDAAVQAMEEKIRDGNIPGITDPAEAKNIVRKGHFTYEQAKNLAKAGTIESLTYDAVNGAIIASSAFGVSALITFATNIWNGEDFDKSLKLATYSGLKVGGNAITASLTVVVLSSLDISNIFRGRISGKQLFKNLTNTATTVAGGTGGWLGGAAIGSAILPGAGTVAGALIGSVAAGAAAGKVTDSILGTFIEDDADAMVKIIQDEFEILTQDYLLNQKEVEKSVDKLADILDGKMLKDMFASDNRKQFAQKLLIPIIENETKKREHIATISTEQMTRNLREVLENISDCFNETDNLFHI